MSFSWWKVNFNNYIRFLLVSQNLGGEYVGHDESVEIVDSALEEDQGSDRGKPLLFALKHIFSSSSESGF